MFQGVVFAGSDNAFDSERLGAFILDMEQKHGFSRTELQRLFDEATLQPGILQAIARPAESKPWHQYRNIFLTRDRIDGGLAFWRANSPKLDEALRRFGVEPEIVVAIIGVETSYGRNTGKYRVIDALATLGFNYPKRATFFRSELENYLLLARSQHFDPLVLTGSYAGAMGLPQFMPSSYRSYAVDFDDDTTIDIWSNPTDAIGSVGNYLREHGWIAGAPITVSARVSGSGYQSLLGQGVKPRMPLSEMRDLGVEAVAPVDGDPNAALVELQAEYAKEYWLGFNNFYVITRYNTSPLYAMAVYQLARALRDAHVAVAGAPQ
ncbi:MAG: Membrane-bound lytic murein transglycosylase B [Gammaproteobacteria bacterium]|nr:Membrane-bound lytic murein transglycosylase B [Gammaproteobacteria bacterium]